MAFDLSFSEEFFTGTVDYPERSETPTSVLQALVSMEPAEWAEYCREHLNGVDPDAECAARAALKRVREVNTCTDLRSPVEVWLEPEGYYSVRVYDSRD